MSLEHAKLSILRSHAVCRLRALVFFWFAAAASSLIQAAPPGWSLVWNDEFEGSSVNLTKWDPILWTTPFNNEQQAYHPDRVAVSGGNLVLTADDADFGGKSYTSGKVESKWSKQYGRWEVRAKLPGTQGTWPAIWLLPDTNQYPWPTQSEIDIMENRGNQPNLTSSAYHYGPSVAGHQYTSLEQVTSRLGQLEHFHDSFHTYAVEWDDSKVRFFVDAVNYYTVYNEDVGGFIGNQTAPAELNLNVAVGGDFVDGAQPNGSSVWPQQMLVDYVRVYERDESPPPSVFKNGNFEAQDGSLASWSTFGSVATTNPNVQVHNEAVYDGSAALKLFGQFSGSLNYSGVEQGISVSPGDNISASLNALTRGADSIAGTNNHVDVKFDYYSEFGGRYGSSSYLSSKTITVADGSSENDSWMEAELTDVAPAGAVEARLVVYFVQPNNEGGAVHVDDVQFVNLDLELDADADGNGQVDGTDFLKWQRGWGFDDATSVSDGDFNFDGIVNGLDLAVWESQYSAFSPAVAAILVPEPGSGLMAAALMLSFVDCFSRLASKGQPSPSADLSHH